MHRGGGVWVLSGDQRLELWSLAQPPEPGGGGGGGGSGAAGAGAGAMAGEHIAAAPPRLLSFADARQVWSRVRVAIMGSQKCRNVGKSQPALIMINPMIFTRTRTPVESHRGRCLVAGGGVDDMSRWLVWDPIRVSWLARLVQACDHALRASARAVSRAFPAYTRSLLTEIHLRHACSCHDD
jgi:hypothetical protein